MAQAEDIKRYQANLQGEIDSATLYRSMAASETQSQLAEVYRRLAEVEDKHARFWQEQLRKAGHLENDLTPSRRVRLMGWLAKHLGPDVVLPSVAAAEQVDRGMYDAQPESGHTEMPMDERSHA